MTVTYAFRGTAATLAFAACVSVAGCSSDGGAGGGHTQSASAPASAPATRSASATPTRSSTPSAAATVTVSRSATGNAMHDAATSTRAQSAIRGACRNGDVLVSTSPQAGQGGAGGHGGFVLTLHNTSGVTCTLHGYPRLDSLRSSGSLLAHARRTLRGYLGGSGAGVPTVSLRPGQSASAKVEFDNVGLHNKGCPQGTKVATTVPNTTRITTLSARTTNCELQVHPVVPGSSGNYKL